MCYTMDCKHENYYGHCKLPRHKICPRSLKVSDPEQKDPVAKIHKQMELFSENLNKKYKGIK